MGSGLFFTAVIVALGVSAFLFVRKPQGGNFYAGLFLIALAVPLIVHSAQETLGISSLSGIAADDCVPFLYPPLLFLYAMSKTGSHARFRFRYFLHFVPFAAVIILLSLTAPSPHPDRSGPPPAGGMFDGERPHPPMDFGRRPHGEPRPPSDGNFFREGDRGPGFPLPEHRPDGKKSCATGVMLIYFAAYSFVIIFRIRKKSRNAEGKYHWLLWIAAAFPVIFFAVLFPAVFDFWNGPGHSSIGMGSALYIILFGFFALKYGVHDQDVNPEEKTGRYEKSGLKGNGVENIIRRIENLMQTEKPYLDPDLSIIAVARRLNIPKHHLTQSLNSGLSKNFYAYINEYRVREAVQRMKSAEFVSCSIIRIAYDCGFNSKSTFNNIFKKIMGQTPSEYRSSCGVRGNPDSGG